MLHRYDQQRLFVVDVVVVVVAFIADLACIGHVIISGSNIKWIIVLGCVL